VRALAFVLLVGCSHSLLLHRDDSAYRRGLAHYQQTRRLVAESLAPDDDQAMFVQAEALFRYRFAPPGTSAGSYFAQVMASLIELPVLDSLAGSLDLYSLRVRMADGAIQIWESLLARSPHSPLRPLALYRLGWAYRNSIASGFPGSSDGALDALIREYPGSSLVPYARDAKQVHWKSQGSATAWSIVPGLGQMYACEYRNGAVRLAIALAAATAIVVPAVIAYGRRSNLDFGRDWPLLVTGVLGATVLTVDYSVSYRDAQRAVLEYNERREAYFEDTHPGAP
jgi:hypothetical protein